MGRKSLFHPVLQARECTPGSFPPNDSAPIPPRSARFGRLSFFVRSDPMGPCRLEHRPSVPERLSRAFPASRVFGQCIDFKSGSFLVRTRQGIAPNTEQAVFGLECLGIGAKVAVFRILAPTPRQEVENHPFPGNRMDDQMAGGKAGRPIPGFPNLLQQAFHFFQRTQYLVAESGPRRHRVALAASPSGIHFFTHRDLPATTGLRARKHWTPKSSPAPPSAAAWQPANRPAQPQSEETSRPSSARRLSARSADKTFGTLLTRTTLPLPR